MPDVIAFTKVKLPYGWLGNMAPYPIVLKGEIWPTSEALFQALRFGELDPIREAIRRQTSPMAAKMVAKANRSRMVVTPMSGEDLRLMSSVLRLKVEAHPELKIWLLSTGTADIIEDSSSRRGGSGLFWGAAKEPDGTWKGENHLGRLWVALRQEWRDEDR